jgi:hypothetical protein
MSDYSMEKTYPPDIEELRRGLYAAADQIKQLIFGAPQDDLLGAVRAKPPTAEQIARMKRDYQDAIAPIVKELANLEAFATLTFRRDEPENPPTHAD